MSSLNSVGQQGCFKLTVIPPRLLRYGVIVEFLKDVLSIEDVDMKSTIMKSRIMKSSIMKNTIMRGTIELGSLG